MIYNNIPDCRLYGELSYLIGLLSTPSEYLEEAACWQTLINEFAPNKSLDILEFGVGGGFNLSHIKKDHTVSAVDLSHEMLDVCKALNPSVELFLGDMRNIKIDKLFDVVLIHDALSYLLTKEDILTTFNNAHTHLKENGVLIISPEFFKETFTQPIVYSKTSTKNGIELTYFEYGFDPDTTDTTFEMIITYYIRRNGRLEIEHDRHTLGIFKKYDWFDFLKSSGFNPHERNFTLAEQKHPYLLIVGQK